MTSTCLHLQVYFFLPGGAGWADNDTALPCRLYSACKMWIIEFVRYCFTPNSTKFFTSHMKKDVPYVSDSFVRHIMCLTAIDFFSECWDMLKIIKWVSKKVLINYQQQQNNEHKRHKGGSDLSVSLMTHCRPFESIGIWNPYRNITSKQVVNFSTGFCDVMFKRW